MKGLFGLIAALSVISAMIVIPGTAFAASDPNAGIAAQVQSYFSDIPVMIAIASCESGDRQFEPDGTPLLGGSGTMVGIFQLDETIHSEIASSLGFDIDTVAGNMAYARYLYGADGTEPWISSFGCWGGAVSTSSADATIVATSSPGITVTSTSTALTVATSTSNASATIAPVLTLDLSLGDIDPQVLTLQQLLNKDGFTLATSGPGSPGNETDKFGALTYAALKAFQCAQGIACSGEEATTGYGYLNSATRAVLLAATPGNTTNSITATSGAADNDPAEVAELQSRIAALVAVVAQLEAELAARGGVSVVN